MKENWLLVLLWVLVIAIISFGVFVLAKYGGKPITEIPSWAVPFFLVRR